MPIFSSRSRSKEYLKEQALLMKQQEAEAAPAPQPAQESSNVVAVAFRQVGWQETKETLLHGLKKGVTRVAVVFWRVALTATTAFALSPVERKESILEKVINTIRNYADMLTNTSTMVEVPRYRYEEYSFIEVPNEQVQEVIDTWVIFRNSVNFTKKSGISLSAVMKAMYYYCEAKGLEYPYTDDTHTWVDAKAVQQFANIFWRHQGAPGLGGVPGAPLLRRRTGCLPGYPPQLHHHSPERAGELYRERGRYLYHRAGDGTG